jgi:hypothetical protein
MDLDLDNDIIFSDNQYRLLGCEPGSFRAVKDQTFTVHPSEDLHIIENLSTIL